MNPLIVEPDMPMDYTVSRRTSLACIGGLALMVSSPGSALAALAPLRFDPTRYEPQQLTVGDRSFAVRAFENIAYVSHPVDAAYQVMNIYVPEAYFQGQQVGGFSAATAPIFLPNQVGGYMPARPGSARPAGQGPRAGQVSTIAVALSHGFVVASPGARGRTNKDAGGANTGKAPAAIVDLKAAVRYLRHNRLRLPGDTERIISNGTSAGGALSALLGASGNSSDYTGYLESLGAADERDDVFAVSAYCPITNLEHADAAYEWLFQGVSDYRKITVDMLDLQVTRKEVAGRLSAEQIALSKRLAATFPAYLNSLQLRAPSGQALTLDPAGQGSFKELVKSYLIASAQTALEGGTALNDYAWLTVQGKRITDIDLDAYAQHVSRLKLPPAFDAADLSSGENSLFGNATVDARHFTDFALTPQSASGAQRAEERLVKMMNAMRYIGAPDARNAMHWRLRHGSADRDTSLAIPTLLATTLQHHGRSVDFAMPWGVPHSGDYDLYQLFMWMRKVAARDPA